MKRNILWAAVVLVCAGGLAFAQEPAPTREDSSPASTPEEGKMTWDDLREEHKTFMGEQREENKAWREDFRNRWHQAIEQCKAGGINPGACHQQYLKDLRQEAMSHRQEQKKERQQHHKDMVDSRQEHIQEWKASHPGANPPGPAGGPGAGPEFKGPPVNVMDHREDVRDHREDFRDRREDVRDHREDVRDAREDVRDQREDVRDRREDVRARKEDVIDRREDVPPPPEQPRAVQKAAQHPQRAKSAVKQHHRASR